MIDLSCGECGSNRLDMSVQEGDQSPIVCGECGHVLGSLGDLKARVERALLSGHGE